MDDAENPGLSFDQVVMACFDNPQFLGDFNRQMGTRLSFVDREPVELMAEEAIGLTIERIPENDPKVFFDFVFHYVWTPMQLRAQAQDRSHRRLIAPRVMEPA